MQRTFKQWLTDILIPYRTKLNKAQEKILLILDGHSTHTTEQNLDFCANNNILLCLLPAHTSHVLQPLDIGVFNSYKAAYRSSISSSHLDAVLCDWTSEATQRRVKMMARALIAQSRSVIKANIRRSFFHSGIYPYSTEHFFFHCNSIANVPDDVKRRAREMETEERENRKRQCQAKGRLNCFDQLQHVVSV